MLTVLPNVLKARPNTAKLDCYELQHLTATKWISGVSVV